VGAGMGVGAGVDVGAGVGDAVVADRIVPRSTRPGQKTGVPACVSFQLVTAKSVGSRAFFAVT
jgi:hypothetical protein